MVDDVDNVYFKALLDLVPAQVYFAEEEKAQIRNADRVGGKKSGHQDPLIKNKISTLQSSLQNTLHSTLNSMEEKIKGKKDSKQKKKKKKEKGGASSTMREAQEKLRARIAQLQAKREGLSSTEQQEHKRLERKQRRLAGRSKNKSKNKVKDAGGVSAAAPTIPIVKKAGKPIVNREGKLVFSKFDFTHSAGGETVEKGKHSSALVGKDYKRLLQRLHQRDAKVAEIKEERPEAAIKLEQKHIWQDVMHKAKGEKVKDDPKLLKKALKRKEKVKDQRKRGWDKRQKAVDNLQKKKQEEREKNLDKRREDKKTKQRKRLIKKGRVLPGF